MPTKPSTFPTWDSNATGISTPNTYNLENGWTDQQSPPYQWVNWLFYWIAQWLGFVRDTASTYQSLYTALSAMSAGDLAFVDEYDGDKFPGSLVTGAYNPTIGNPVVSVDTDGEITVYLESGGVARAVQSRWTSANFTTTDRLVTYTLTSFTATARVIRTNGQYTVVAYDNHAEIFNAVTGASIADIDHGAAVHDVCLDGVRMYLVGASGTGVKTVRCITLATGASVWTYDHGGTTYSCCTDGRRLFIAGDASGHASLATHRALEAATGNDLANEGGTAASNWPDIWDLAQANTVAAGERLVTDGRGLWAGYGSGMTNQVEQIGTAAGVLQASWDIGENVRALAIDHQCVFAAGATKLVCFDKAMFPNIRWVSETDDFDGGVCSDGFMVTGCGAGTATGGEIQRRYRRNRPCQIRMCTPADQYNPYNLAFIPAGE